jgi:hypothetical protein
MKKIKKFMPFLYVPSTNSRIDAGECSRTPRHFFGHTEWTLAILSSHERRVSVLPGLDFRKRRGFKPVEMHTTLQHQPNLQKPRVALSAWVAALFLIGSTGAAECGPVVFRQDFSKYSGAYKKWSHAEAKEDFNVPGPSRPSGSGISLAPGLGFGQGFDNCDVGEGNMRLKFPKGDGTSF